MATGIKINDFLLNLLRAKINFDTDTFRLALSNVAPASETNNPTTNTFGVIANVTQISYTNYADNLTTDRVLEGVLETVVGGASAGVGAVDTIDVVVSAAGGALATFRYIYIYDDTQTSPADPLIGCWDHGAAITLADGEQITLRINAAGFLTIT